MGEKEVGGLAWHWGEDVVLVKSDRVLRVLTRRRRAGTEEGFEERRRRRCR